MKNLQDMLLSIAMVGFVVVVFAVNCDAEAQSRTMNTITRTVARSVARAVVTQVTIEEPDVVGFSSRVIEESEAWVIIRQHTEFDSAGCAEVTARRFDERTRYRARLCSGGTVTTLRRE